VIPFVLVIGFTILQRLIELRVTKRNTERLLRRGAIEYGADHYWMLITLHTLFFASMIGEYLIRRPALSDNWALFLGLFLAAQTVRAWVILTMRARWTTRILVLPGESLIAKGPFQYFPHPNYLVVAIEILSLPLLFQLVFTASFFTVLNALVLLGVRIPKERVALRNAGAGPLR